MFILMFISMNHVQAFPAYLVSIDVDSDDQNPRETKFIVLAWDQHVRTYVFHMLGSYVSILYNWLILWQNALYL